MNSKTVPSGRWAWQDTVLLVCVSVATYIYTGYIWPYLLVGLDEGAFVYEAKRILGGEVMYRDFFDLTGPIAQHLLALWYGLFGITMETSRLHTALQHAIIAVCGYVVCRRVGVRRSIAAVCALTDLALFFPEFSMASSHWVATMFSMILFWYVVRTPLVTPRAAIIAGILTALIALTRQPKGIAFAGAVTVVLARDAWCDRATAPWLRALVQRAASYAAGVLGLVLPVLAALVVAGGFWPVFEALVLVPLGPYRDNPFVREGGWMLLQITPEILWLLIITASPMLILNVLPFIIPVSAVRLARLWLRGAGARETRPLFIAVIFSALAMISMLYQPNFFHFAIVGPIWVVLYAESIERMLQRMSRWAPRARLEPIAVAVLLVLLGLRVGHDLPERWRRVAASDRSSFGRVDLRTVDEANDIAAVRAILHEAGATQIFVYPSAAALYLMTDTDNPTRFQLLLPSYNTEEHFREVRETLERERVPFVVRSFYYWGGPKELSKDALLPYLNEHYEGVPIRRAKGAFPHLQLLRRRAQTDAVAPPPIR